MMFKIRLFFVLISIMITAGAHAQVSSVTISGIVKNKADQSAISYVNVVVKNEKDSVFVAGTVTNDEGRFSITGIKPGNYRLKVSYMGYDSKEQSLFIGSLSAFLDIPVIEINENSMALTVS